MEDPGCTHNREFYGAPIFCGAFPFRTFERIGKGRREGRERSPEHSQGAQWHVIKKKEDIVESPSFSHSKQFTEAPMLAVDMV